MRVLYVEDEAPVRDALMRAFRWSAPDLICDVAGDLDQALAKLESLPVFAPLVARWNQVNAAASQGPAALIEGVALFCAVICLLAK